MTRKEYKIQLREFLKLLCVVLCALLYALGGIEHKWIRRFVMPFVLTLSMFGFSRDWRVFLQAPMLMLSLSLGYGATTLWTKIIRRFIFGIANGSTAMVQMLITERWKLFAFHVPLCIAVCVFFGVYNPFGSARAEELAIGFILCWLPMYMVNDRK